MSKTIAIFGAGPALGMSVARRFGREGFQVALVARTRSTLDGFVDELATEGVEAAAFTTDLTDPGGLADTIAAIEERFGHLDVVEYGPSGIDSRPVPAPDVEIDDVRSWLDLLVLTPIALVRAVLPGMVDRGDGALLFSMGASAKYPMPIMGNIGIAGAGALNYVHALNGSLTGKGVYVGSVIIGAIIERSAAARLVETSGLPAGLADESARPTFVDPDEIADIHWDMYLKRDRIEEVVGGLGQ